MAFKCHYTWDMASYRQTLIKMKCGNMKQDKTTPAHYCGVQALRGFAAIIVVLFHIAKMVHEKLGGPAVEFAAGSSGVDIFFAISGFVMILTTAHAWGTPRLWRTFLRRRLLRIVPLYWLMTAVMVVLLLTMPSLAQHSTLQPWHSVSSFLFIPAWNAYHEAYPLLVVGWTLSFEMLFYLLFTAILALHLHPARWGSVVLFTLAALSLFRTDAWGAPATLFDPLLLEFVFSMWIGMATLKGLRIPQPIALWLAPAMVCLIFATCLLPSEFCFKYRVIVWGMPGALLVASIVALEDRLRPYVLGLPSLLGDASYAIYLSHGFVITFVSVILTRLHLGYGLTLASGWAGSIILSLIVGIAIHRFIELSLIAALRQFSHRQMPLTLERGAA